MSHNINFANYGYEQSPFPTGLGRPTSVGTNGSPSFFGTYDQTGNVAEHTEKKVLFTANDQFSPYVQPTGGQVFKSKVFVAQENNDIDKKFPAITGLSLTNAPTIAKPEPASVPGSQNFGYGNANRGGSFTASTGNLGKDQKLSYSIPTVAYSNVGFRVAAASDVISLTGVIVQSTGSTIVYVPSGQIGSGSSTLDDDVYVGMDIDGTQFADNAKITKVHNTFTTLTSPVSGEYNSIELSLAPVATGSNLTVTASMDNPLHLKNMVLVDSSGNNPDGFDPGYGKVNYNYRIGKYPVTNSEYALFLNEVAYAKDNNTTTDTVALTYYSPATSSTELNMAAGIQRVTKVSYSNGTTFSYLPVRGAEDKPVVGVTWLQAARYCNWLHRRVTLPDTINTDTGAYNLKTPLQNMSRENHARYFLPNENEFYKSAYYGKESSSFVYRKFATRTNTIPSQIPSVNKYGDAPFRNLTDISLFDRFSFDRIGNLRWVGILNAAADRWDQYLSHVEYSKITDADAHAGFRYEVKDKSRYDVLASYSDRNHRRSFKGLYLDQIGFVYSTQSWIASGEPRSMTVVGSATQSKKVMPLSFGLIINTRFNTTYTDDEWIEIIVSQLGRALGFGYLWKYNNFETATPIASDYFLDIAAFPKTNIEYNRVAYGITGGYTRKYTPSEQSGGAGIAGNYWEDNYLTDGECFTPLNCAVDTPYVGIKDIMNSTYRKGEIISNITIANMVDLGYYSKDNTFTGEGDFQPIYSGIDPSSAP